jgi:glucokinase
VGAHLGVALASVTNLLNPDYIVIGGGVANAGSVLFDEVKKTLLARAMRVQGAKVRVVKAVLGSDAGLIGAAVLVQQGANA